MSSSPANGISRCLSRAEFVVPKLGTRKHPSNVTRQQIPGYKAMRICGASAFADGVVSLPMQRSGRGEFAAPNTWRRRSIRGLAPWAAVPAKRDVMPSVNDVGFVIGSASDLEAVISIAKLPLDLGAKAACRSQENCRIVDVNRHRQRLSIEIEDWAVHASIRRTETGDDEAAAVPGTMQTNRENFERTCLPHAADKTLGGCLCH